MRSVRGGACVLLLLTTGCELDSTEELLSITFGVGAQAPPVEVDTLCGNGGCQSAPELGAVLAFSDDGAIADDARAEILQYRVDFAIGGFEGEEVPYYAGATSVEVGVGGTAEFFVRVAGDRQRDFFASRLGAGEANGVGTLTLAGYDDDDEIVQVSADFDVAFGDFVVDGAPPDAAEDAP